MTSDRISPIPCTDFNRMMVLASNDLALCLRYHSSFDGCS